MNYDYYCNFCTDFIFFLDSWVLIMASCNFLNHWFLALISFVIVAPLFSEEGHLPPNSFRQSDLMYENMGAGPLSLKWAEPKIELPDMKGEILFYGKSERPDYREKNRHLLALRSSGETQMVERGKPIYLAYEGERPGVKGRFHFSDKATNFWMEIIGIEDNAIQLALYLQDAAGNPIVEPKERRNFALKRDEFPVRSGHFEVGDLHADSSLLYRQHARVIGKDLFLEQHGGEEFAFAKGRDRLDFGEGENCYCCFVKEGDYFIWKEGRWRRPEAGEESCSYPLLIVKGGDDKVMNFDLWSADAKIKVPLNLPRLSNVEPILDVNLDFKFVGAKTWAQFLLDYRGQRTLAKINDWFVFVDGEWKLIQTEEELNDYVERRLVGPLFIIDKWEKKEGKQALTGHIFNASRNQCQEVSLPVTVKSSDGVSSSPNLQMSAHS